MTLILATVQPTACIITADGGCWRDGRLVATNYVKIYPVPGCPLAFAHYGLDALGGMSVGQHMAEFLATRGAQFAGLAVEYVAECVAAWLHSSASVSVQYRRPVRASIYTIGFACGSEPRVFHATWYAAGNATAFEMTQDHGEPLHMAGAGAESIWPFLNADVQPELGASRVRQEGHPYAYRLHDALYATAQASGEGVNRPEGHRHRLLIEPAGWKWVEPPTGQ